MAWLYIFLLILYSTRAAQAMECSRFKDRTVMRVALNNKCYYAWFTATATYARAVYTCRGNDTHVLFTETETEQSRIATKLGPEFRKIWIGLEKRNTEWGWYSNDKSLPVTTMRFANKRASTTGTNAIARQMDDRYVWEVQEPHLKFRIVCEQESAELFSDGFTESISLARKASVVIESSIFSSSSDPSESLSPQSLAPEWKHSLLLPDGSPPAKLAIKTTDFINFPIKAMPPGLMPVFPRGSKTVKELDSTYDMSYTTTTISTDFYRLISATSGQISPPDSRTVEVKETSPSGLVKDVVPTVNNRDLVLETILPSESAFGRLTYTVNNADANTAAFNEGVSRLATDQLSTVTNLTSQPISANVNRVLSVQQTTLMERMDKGFENGDLHSNIITQTNPPSEDFVQSKNNADLNLQRSFFGSGGSDVKQVTGYRIVSMGISGSDGSFRTFVLRRDSLSPEVAEVTSLSADSLLDCVRVCVNHQTVCNATVFKDKTCSLYSNIIPQF